MKISSVLAALALALMMACAPAPTMWDAAGEVGPGSEAGEHRAPLRGPGTLDGSATDLGPEGDLASRAGSEARLEAGRVPEAGLEAEVDLSSAGREVGAEPGIEVGPEPGPEAGPEVGREAITEPGPGPEAGLEVGPEPGPEAGPEVGPEPRPEAGPEVGPEPGPEVGPEPGPEAGPEVGREAGPEVRACPSYCSGGCYLGCNSAGECVTCATCSCDGTTGACHC